MKNKFWVYFVVLFLGAFIATEAEAQKVRGGNIGTAGSDGVNQAKGGYKYWYKRNVIRRAPHNHRWIWSKRREYWTVGINASAMNYFGDIVPRPEFTSTDIRFTRPYISVFATKRFRPQMTGRFMIGWGRAAGADSTSASPTTNHDVFRYIRNASFRNDVVEFSTSINIDLASEERLNKEYYKRPSGIIPYVTLGIGVFHHNPKAKTPSQFGGDWVALQPIGTEGQGRSRQVSVNDSVTRTISYGDKYSRWQVCFPLGIGFRKKLSAKWDLAFEVNYRFMLTDYFDDVSRKYVDPGLFGDDELGRAMHDRSREDGRADRLAAMFDEGNLAYWGAKSSETFTGVDGKTYTTFIGFGNENNIENIRGNSRDRDVLLVTGFHLSYILAPESVVCPLRYR